MEHYRTLTGTAGADLKWGQFVKFDNDGDFVPCTVAGEEFVGVSVRGDHKAGDTEVMVVVVGDAEVGCADATVEAGDLIMTGTTGFAVKAVGTDVFVVRALGKGRAAGTNGGRIRIPCSIPSIPTAVTVS